MDYNHSKYFVEHSDVLTEAEKIQMAKDLVELERQGIIEYRDGFWGIAAGIDIEETPDGSVARIRKTQGAMPGEPANSATSSGEPSDAQVAPPLTKVARPSIDGSSSPDSDDQESEQ